MPHFINEWYLLNNGISLSNKSGTSRHVWTPVAVRLPKQLCETVVAGFAVSEMSDKSAGGPSPLGLLRLQEAVYPAPALCKGLPLVCQRRPLNKLVNAWC
jgi:hypothetical protein